jgi:hypothetical protein
MCIVSTGNLFLIKEMFILNNSRQEVSSLGTAKKGWQKTVQAQQASNALILSNEQKQDHSSSSKLSQELGVKKPRTSMELERDLRRLSTLQDKNR